MGAAANHEDESSPLLPAEAADEKLPPAPAPAPEAVKYCADGVPVVMGEPVAARTVGGVPRESWNSGILSCLGRNDEFCSSDLEVCTCSSTSDQIVPSALNLLEMCVVSRLGIAGRNGCLYTSRDRFT
jgi:hypothetical protein